MDVITYALSRKYVDKSIQGITGTLAGKNCTISNVSKNGLVITITFQWTADNGDVNTTQVQVTDGETPSITSTPISGGHRITLSTNNPSQDVEVDVLDGVQGAQGISVVSSNVDENNNLTLTLSNGNIIDAGKIKAVTTVDNALSTASSNPVENKVITNALNNKVDKETGKGLFSDVEKTKLANIEDGAQVNVLEKLIVNGQEATITDKSVALTLITSAVSNLQNYYLKTETYTKQEVEDLIGSTVGVTIEIVQTLPTEGQSNVIYFLPTETEGVYSQYIYSNNSWILIGSTTVDLSNYYTKTQVDTLLNGKQNTLTIDSFPTALSNNPVASGGVYTAIAQMQPQFQFANMPTASASNLGFVYQYTGATGAYTQNMFYRCVYDDTLGEYKWVEVLFHATVTVDSAISGTSTNPVQNKVIKEALDTKQDIIQYSTMPSAQDNLGRTVQYVGTNTANYTNGYFYKAVYDSERDIYLWTVVKFSADMLVDSALSTSSENPVQNKIITSEINGIKDVIPQSATSANKLVDSASLGTASTKSYTTNVEPNNHALVESNAVYNAISSSIASVYKPHGDLTCAELTSAILVALNVGNIYNMTDSGTTTDLFIQGAGKPISKGNTVGVVQTGANTYKFNLMGNMIDLHNYQTKTLEAPLTIGNTAQTTVEGALGALNTTKATQADVVGVYKANGILGAKNLLPNNDETKTINNVIFVENDDGSVTVSTNAPATAHTWFMFVGLTNNDTSYPMADGDYILSSTNKLPNGVQLVVKTDPNTVAVRVNAGENENPFTLSGNKSVSVGIRVAQNTEITTPVTIYPMIRLASDPNDTYVPYAMTNQQITPYVQSISNPNLLDNPWFTVNQRAQSSYTTNNTTIKTVDRWYINAPTERTMNVVGDGIKFPNGMESFFETIEPELVKKLKGKVVTLSVKFSGTPASGEFFGIIADGHSWYVPSQCHFNSAINGIASITFEMPNFTNTNRYHVWMYIQSAITIHAVKLELGSVSTLAMDTIPNYATELLKCQSYFERNNWYAWGCIRCRDAGILQYGMTYPFLAKKRSVPTFTFNVAGEAGIGNGYIYDITNGTSIPVSEVALQQPGAYNYRMIQVKMSHSSFVVGHDYCLAVGDNVIDISADL